MLMVEPPVTHPVDREEPIVSVEHAPTASEIVDPPHRGHQTLATGALGLPQVLFCIVTGCAPIAAMLFNDPWAVYGAGWAAPSAFIVATVAFFVFSIGYVQMAKRVTAAGGFYSFVSHGFGQTLGMGTAVLIAGCYIFFSAGVAGVTAYFTNATLQDWIGWGPPVWAVEAITLAIMAALAYLHIELTAKVLGFFLVIEVTALLVFSVAALFQSRSGLHLSSLEPWKLFDGKANGSEKVFGAGTLGVGFFGAFWSWIGFEMAPNYAEESREPKRIMGPATYISVIGLGILYTFVTWMLVVAWGASHVAEGVNQQFSGHIASVFYPQTDRVFGLDLGSASLLTRAFQLTIVTGSFACQLAFFNTATRYLFSMGREGVLPRQLGRTHRVHHSPFVAATTVAAFVGLIMGGFLLKDHSTLGALLKLGTWAPMMGNIGILAIMALVSLAIIRYFLTAPNEQVVGGRWFSVVIAPLLATAAMVFTTYLLIENRTTLGGAKGVLFVDYMWVWPLALFALGVLIALVYRSRDHARYEGIGRYLHEDIAETST
jgi:amino acid transporter